VRFRLKKIACVEAEDAAVSYQIMSTRKFLDACAGRFDAARWFWPSYELWCARQGLKPVPILPSTLAGSRRLDDRRLPRWSSTPDRVGVTTAIVQAGVLCCTARFRYDNGGAIRGAGVSLRW